MGADRSSVTVGGRRVGKLRPGAVTARAVRDPAEAREVVRDWIVSAGFSPTEERIAALLPVARVWSGKARRVAIGLVAAGQLPTRAAVEAVTLQRIEAKTRAAAQLRVQAEAFVAARGAEVAAWVRQSCEVHGHGPLWFELGQSLQLDYQLRKSVIRVLEHEGWISTGPETRSMRPGPRSDLPPSESDA